jgi:hypothetical protein
MNMPSLLQKMHDEKTLSAKQLNYLLDIHKKNLFSVHQELRFFFYAGMLLIIAGLGLTIKQYFAQLGDIAIIGSLAAGALASFIYCFAKGNSYSREEVTSPNIAFDYILFFGCTLYSMDIAYSETQFHILGDFWNNYLLASSALFLFLAYRYDNRVVLSLALSTLAAWFGFTVTQSRFSFQEYHRLYAIVYSGITLFIGILLYRLAIKKHFFDIYLNFAAHFLFVALISGVIHYKLFSLYFLAMLTACTILVLYSLRAKRFLYMLYAIVYGYVGISIAGLDIIGRNTFLVLSYFIVTSLAVIILIFSISRKFKEHA